jgi:nucleoside-specific outer membrane channel protein Tsx
MLKKLLAALVITAAATSVNAKTLWSDFSVTALAGNDYEVGDSERTVITFEHAAGTTWGDSFMFFDRLESADGSTETYGEFTARIKLKELNGFVKALYAAPSVEIGQGFTNYLYGVGADLDIPGFTYFQANAFFRNNDFGDNSQQLTFVWGLPIGPLWYDGFMDYATSAGGNSKAQMNLTSQLKYDIAPHIGYDSKFYVGIEYVFWNNKFGINGVDERNVNLLAKFHF